MKQRPRILHCDDNPDALDMYREILGALPCQPEVHTANCGPLALAMLEAEPFDLLICDLKLPKMDGFQVLEIVRHKHPQLPTMVLTCNTDEKFRMRSYELGVDLFCDKPTTDQKSKMWLKAVEALLGGESGGSRSGWDSPAPIESAGGPPLPSLQNSERHHARITGTPDDGYVIEFNGQKESGFITLAEAKLAADELERGVRAVAPDTVGVEREGRDLMAEKSCGEESHGGQNQSEATACAADHWVTSLQYRIFGINYSIEEIPLLVMLRSIEWDALPIYATRAIAPAALFWVPWWQLLLAITVACWLWSAVRTQFVSLRVSMICVYLNGLIPSLVANILVAAVLFATGKVVLGFVALFWHLIATAMNWVCPPGGMPAIQEKLFAQIEECCRDTVDNDTFMANGELLSQGHRGGS